MDNSLYQDDEVLQQVVKKLSPYTIYNMNQEFIRSFVTTLANYAPVSINITDYWNKSIKNSSLLVRDFKNTDWAFRFEDGVDETNFTYKNGYNEGPFFGDLYIKNDKSCDDRDGFYLNSLIGLQDKLAEIFMNNIYTVAEKSINDPILHHRLSHLLSKLGYNKENESKFFDKINTLFSENSYMAHREFNSRKGQPRAHKYIMKQAQDANIQGDLTKQFYFKYTNVEPFYYQIEGSLVPSIYESFIVPLAHPIGFTYDYFNVCYTEFKETVFRSIHHSADAV